MAHSARRRIGRAIAHAAVLAAGLLACASTSALAADPSAPTASFVSWTESSPYAWYNAGNDIDRLWFNPNYSGSATARITAADPQSGILYATFPNGPAGWNAGGISTTPGSGNYDWTYSWVAGAAGGTPTATATHGDPLPPGSQQSAPVIVEFVPDSTAPTVSAGSVAFSVTGWRTTANFNITYPNSPAFSDTGSSATGVGALTRLLQYRDGVPDGAGGCNTTAGVWTTLATNPAGTSYAATIPADGVCWEARYRIEDSVGNALNMYASGFRGLDTTNPGVVVTNIAEGANPGFQKVVAANDIWYNGLQSGDFTVTAVPNDATSGVAQIRWGGLGTWLSPNVNTTVFDPGPWTQVYSWNASSTNPGAQTIRVQDYAGNAVNVGSAFWIRRDVTAPSATGSTLTYATPAWKNTPSITITHSGAMTDTQAGIASYQLQREEQPWVSGACQAFTGVYTNIGAPVYGDPPPNLGSYVDTTVTDGNCYRYRIEAYDHVGIIGYHQPTTNAMVDDTDPTGTMNALPPIASGNVTVGGTIADTMSGLAAPAQVAVRIEDQANLGTFIPLYTDTTVGTGVWGNYTWNTTALNGTYKVYVDLTDAAGNTVLGAVVQTIVIDNTAPTMTFTGFTEGTNPGCQYVPALTPTSVWVKTNGTCSGDVVATFAPVDAQSGIDHITVPAGPAGWTPNAATPINDPGPWTQTYAWATGANNFNTRNATATNKAGMNSANVPFTITTDNTNPAGGAVSYPTGWRITAPLPITVTNYTDAGSGIYHQQLLRDDAPRPVGGTCGVATWPGTFSTVVAETIPGDPNQTLPGTINDATVVTGVCYRYRLVADDNVSNSVGTSTTPGAVVHDLVDPVATIDTGTPTSPLIGTKTITGTSDDGPVGPNSGVANVTIRWENLDDSTTGTIGVDTGASPLWAINWNTTLGATPDGHYRIHVDVTDVAGRTVPDITTRDVTIDNSPPTISIVAFTPTSLPQCQYYPGSGTTHFVNRLVASGCNGATYDVEVNADDQPGGMQYVRFGNNGAFYPTLGGSGNNYDMFAPPWKTEFTYLVSAGTLVRTINITARGNTGAQTVLPTTLVLDMVGPTGMTFTGPGGTTSPSYWTNAATINVPFNFAGLNDPDVQVGQVGSGIRTGQHVISRRETTNVNCAGGWSAWTTISAPGPASPFPDGSTATGTCYQYRIGVMDNVNNTGWFQDITNQIRVDRVNPTGTMAVVPPYVKGTVTLSGTSADNWSGVASLSVRIGAGPATACTPAVAAGWTCSWDTTTAANGPTTLTLVATDNAGNVVDAATRNTYVDNELPSGAVTLTSITQPQWQHIVPGPTPKVFINTAQAGGSFQASVAATDAFSGILDVQTPALGAGWSPAGQTIPGPSGPYQTTYTWTGPSAAGPGVVNATMRDNTLNSATAPFEVVSDTAAPASASIQYAGGPTSVPSITFDKGTETGGSGNKTWRIERDDTTLNGPGSCDPFTNTWTTVATDPAASPWTDPAVVLNHCYRYRLVSVDNVANSVTVTDPENDVVTVEPAGIVIVESAGSTAVAEGGATDTYTVKLRTQPAANVTVTIGNVDGQLSVGSTTLTFTPANWNTPQTVTVTAVDDPDDEVPDPHSGTLTHVAASPGDPAYDALAGANVVATITDNDVSGITLSPSASTVDVNEAGATSDTYTIVLTSRPSANVVITTSNADGQVAASPATLTFTSANWNVPQTVTVTAVNDAIDEAATHPGVVQHAVASGDPLYAPLTIPDVTANVTDDDTAGVTLTPASGLTLDENAVGTTAAYQVVLTSQPLANVTINVVGDAQATPSTGSLLFTPANWNVPQTVTMTVVDDLVVEGPHTSTVAHAISSPGDPTYAAVAIPSQSIAITDNDVPGIDVTPAGPLTVAEGGATASYDIKLKSQPTQPVTIAFTTDAQVAAIGSLTFTPANWNTPQTVTVTAVDDAIDEPSPHPSTITHAVTSTDPVYNGWSLAAMSVQVTDNDTAGITIDDLGGVQVDEANVAATDTFTVVLQSQPVAPVTIALTPDSQVTVAPSPLTFTPANWNVPQVVTVTAVNDPIDEASPHAGSVSFAAAGDPLYAAITPPPLAVSVLDDDTAGITVSPGTLALDETLPSTDTYTVVLDSLPGSNVTVTVAPDAQVSTPDTSLVFTPANWNVPQTVHVSAVDDPTVETTPHAGQLTHSVTSADTGYAAIVPAAKSADIVDNDTPGITVAQTGTTDVTEGGATDTYTVVLDRQPRLGETVTVTVAGDAQATAAPGTLTFDHANWNVVQTVTVTAVDDNVQEVTPHPATITNAVSATDPLWASVTSAPSVTANVTDDDVAGVTVTTVGPHALSENTPAATVSYDVVLDTQPTSNVTINLTVPGDLNASTTTLTFTPVNWNVPQTVTVNAIDDAVTEAPVHARLITSAIVTGDAFYGAVTVPDVQFDVTDNDIPGITVNRLSLAATEGGATDSFSVVLDTQPTGNVTVDLTGTQVGFDVDPIVFTPGNWNVPQVVTVTAIDDPIDEASPHAGLVELDVSSPDPVYDLWPLADIPVDVTDNDTAGVTVTPGTPIAVSETGPTSATYTLVLDTQPSANVVVAIATADGQTTASVPSVTFTPANWNVAQVVTVTAVDDHVDEAATHPGLVTHVATSGDANYAGITIADQQVDVTDDDTADVLVTPTSGLTLAEASVGTTASFDVVLASQPTANVTVALTTPDGQTTVAPTSLLFTPANWNVPQTATVTVVDDAIDEAATHTGTVVVSVTAGGDPGYDPIDPPDVTADIADDDSAGVDVTETGGSTDVDEAGLTDTYAVVLRSQPTANVTIAITGGPQASTSPSTLTFTTANWNVPQVVTVNGTPDSLVEGAHTQLFTHAATSGDSNYSGITIADVTANVTDDDVAGATITPGTVNVTEGGATATYDVVLDAQPTANVTIAIATPDGQTTTSPSSLTFTNATWNVPQAVTVTAVDDLVTEPSPHAGTITHAMTSADTNFNVPVADVTAAITDNDVPGVDVTPTTVSVAEGGATATYDVVLLTNPGANVQVAFSEPGQLQPLAPLTFTTANWNVPQTVTVTALDDFVMEGAHTTTITVDTTSAAPAYDTGALTITPVHVDIADNDTAGVLLTPSSGLAGSEGGPNVTYAMSLTSQPTNPITITLAGDADGAPVTTSYTFTPVNWATPQNVDVAIVQDAIAEGPHTTTVTGTINAGADTFYGAVVVPNQVIDITDDDTAGVSFTPASPGPLAIAEGGATATYDVVLTSQPTANVTITGAAIGGQATSSPSMLTFTAANWNVPQTVTVTAVDDAVDESTPHPDTIAHVMGGGDATYAALVPGDMDLAIDDNDTAGVRIDPVGPDTAVTEGGAGDTITVVLESQPIADVDVTLTPDAQVVLGATTLTFTPANWNVPQVVTVDAFDDAIDEGPHAGAIDALTGSVGDPAYVGLAAVQHVVSITDNDTAGVIVTPPAATDLDEAAPLVGQAYQVRLATQPTGNVDVVFAPDAQVSTTPATLTFTTANWNVDQTVTTYPVDDAVAEANPHPGVVSHDTSSLDPKYGTGVLTIPTVTFDIADNDTPGIQVSPTSGHAVAEGGATSTYDVVLLSQPTADVTFTPVSTQLDWSVPSITFTTANWNVPQTVTLRAIDDNVDEPDPHPGTLDMTVTSADPGYAVLVPATVDASIIDNDTSDLVVTPASGLTVDEAGALPAGTYTLTLTSIPSAPVTVTVAPDAQVAASVPSVVLDGANWNTGVTVDVTAIDDQVAEASPHPGTIHHTMASADPNFDAETGPDEVVDVLDDDVAGVLVTPTGADTTVAEDGSLTDGYDIVLTSEPIADVTIDITPDAQVAVAPTTLTFTSANWNVPQTVNVTAVDDHVIEGPHTGTIQHAATSADPNYQGITIADELANVLDDDVAGVVVTPAGGTFAIAEGGSTDTINVQLTTSPVAPVTIDLTADAQATLSAASVTLDSGNWNTGVDVTVTAVDDGYIEPSPHPAVIGFAVNGASDPAYVGLVIPDSTADVTDNDSASVTVDDLGGITLDEANVGATDTFEVRLGASPAPGQSVDVTVTTDAAQLTAAPTTLTFDDSNWNVPQTVTVTVVDDAIDEADPHTSPISFTTSSADTNFDALTVASVDATIADDDAAGLVLDTTTVAVDEAGPTSATVQVHLASQPLGTVEVALASDAQVIVGPAGPLSFDAGNWNVDQTVTITAVDDPDDEASPHPGIVTLTASSVASADPAYDALAPVDVTADVTDDDTSGVTVTPTGGTEVDEANPVTTMTWDVVLDTRPTGNVTVTLLPDAQVATVGAAVLTFTPANWNVPQQAELRANDDPVDEADPHPGLLAFGMGGTDPLYTAVVVPSVSVDVRDDDTAGITVTQSPSPQPLAEDGSVPAATYDVVLDTQPSSDVTVTLAPDAQVGVGAPTLTFTPANWNVPQTVTVDAVDDPVTEPSPHPGKVVHTSDSLDPAYALVAALPIADAAFDIADDDVPSFHFSPVTPAPSVDEANVAATATYDLYIDTVPAGPVTVNFAATGGDVTVSPSSHTFTPGNFATPVTITVTAVDDHLPEANPHTDTITHLLDPTSDPSYLPVTIPDVTASIADDDVAQVVVDDHGGIALDEAAVGTTGTFDVRLAAQPLPGSPVTVTLATPDGQTTVSPAVLTFDDTNWNVVQVVTVTVVDDHVTEATPHPGAITITTSSTDVAFDALTTPDVVAQVADDDVPGFVIVDPTPLTMDEADVAGTERTMSIALATSPATPVTIHVGTGTQLGLQSLPTLTFDSSNWNVPQDVVVRAIDDLVAEPDPHPGLLLFTVDPASDPLYAPLTIADRTFDISDDDLANVAVTCTPGADWNVNGGGHVDLSETPADATHDVVCAVGLGTIAAQDVTIDIVTDPAQVTVDVPHVVIPAGTNGPVDVTFTAVDDHVDEASPHTSIATWTVGSTDPIYAAETMPDTTFDIVDDDTAGVTVAQVPAPQPLAEDGSLPAATYTVVLDSQPTADVTIDATPDGQVDTGGTTTLTFTPGNWNVAQTVTVTAVDDHVTEPSPHAGVVTHAATSADTAYQGITIADATFDITDDDVPSFHFVPATPAPAVDEANVAATATYELWMDTIPGSPVTVDLSAAGGDVTVSPSSHTFTPATWNTPVTITVTAIDDHLVEGPHTDTITHVVNGSSDPGYVGVTIPDVTVDVADDDFATIVTDDLGGVALDEGAVGTTDTFTVALGAQPTASVDVSVTPDAQTTVDLPTLTFTSANWNVPQTVTVTVVDDPVVEASPHPGAISFGSTSADTAFNGLVAPDVVAQITDNDTPGWVVTPPASTTLDEADPVGTAQTFQVALATKPAPGNAVTLSLLADPQVELDPTTPGPLVFDDTNWNVPQPVTVRAIDDQAVEATPHTGVLSFDASASTEAAYATLPLAPMSFDITDDDTPGVTFSPAAPGPLAIAEGGATATYTVVLDKQPLANVTVDITAPDGQSTVDLSTLTFTSATWNVPQTVTVTAVDDSVAEGSHVGHLHHVVGGDPAWTGVTPADMDLDISDNDTAGVTVAQVGAPQPLDEAGTLPAATYTVVLDSQPTQDVTLTPTVDTQVVASPATPLTFTTANWNVPQTITVTAVQDTIVESDPHPGKITHDTASTDPAYDTGVLTIADADFSITDDDAAGFTITPLAPAAGVDEANVAATASYDISIDTVPAGTVTVDLTTGPDVAVSPATITFDSSNAGTPQTVTVTAIDDAIVEGPETEQVHHAVSSVSDPAYDLFVIGDVAVDVADDDVAGVATDDGGGISLDEANAGTTGIVDVTLTAQPAGTVTVDVATPDGQTTVAPTTLTFDNTNWNVPQPVTVTVVDDALSEGPHTGAVTFSTTSAADPAFDALVVPDVTVDIADDDVAAVLVTAPSPALLDEANSAATAQTLTVTLATSPATPVTVLGVSDGQVTVGPNPVVLDSSNWNTGVTVSIAAVDDAIAELDPHPGTVDFQVVDAMSDPAYAGLTTGPQTFQITDDDAAAASLQCLPGSDWNINGGGHLDMAEATGAPEHDVQCDIVLGTAPAADVTVDITTTPSADVTVSPASVTIPAGTNAPVTVTFTATDDQVAQGTHGATIDFAVTTTDPVYGTATVPTVDVDIADDDVAGVTATPAGPLSLAEGGPSTTVDVVLTSQPTASVDVAVNGAPQVAATPGTLTFTTTNWNVPQTITVSAIDDNVDEPDPHPGLLTFAFTSADAAYAAAAVTPIAVSITDNDTPGVVIATTNSGNAVAEGGATDTFTMQLGTQPTANVDVTVAGDAQVGVVPATVTFTPADWNTPQTVTLTAVQDQVVEGDHTGNVTFALSSGDVSYVTGSSATPAAQPVAITDDDLAGFDVVESDGSTKLTEAGQTDTYTVVLKGQPTADVAIAVDGGTQVTGAPAGLTFTPANWNTPQTVTLTAVQDSIDEPDPHPGEVKHVVTTSAAGWTGVLATGVTASIADDDEAKLIVEETDGSTKVTEGAKQGDVITLRLSSQPVSDVSVIPTGDDQVEVGGGTVILGKDNWRGPVEVPVTAVDDDDFEGDHEGVVTFKVTTDDPGYANATANAVIVSITDNEVDDGIGGTGGDDEEGTRTPRTGTPPASTRPGSKKDSTSSRRTSEGAGRTSEGRTRLPGGVSSTPQAEGDGVRKGQRLGGEITAATEDQPKAERTGPIAWAAKWLRDHWKLWVPLLALGLAAAGVGAYMLRSDPARAAQKAASKAGDGRLAAGGRKRSAKDAKSRNKPRRMRRAGKKDDDDEDEDEPGAGSPRPSGRR